MDGADGATAAAAPAPAPAPAPVASASESEEAPAAVTVADGGEVVHGGLGVPAEADPSLAAAGATDPAPATARAPSAKKKGPAAARAKAPSPRPKSALKPKTSKKTSKKTSGKTGSKPASKHASKPARGSKGKGREKGNGKKSKDADRDAVAERPVVQSLIKKSEMRLAVLPPDAVAYKPAPPSVPAAQKPWSVELTADEYDPLVFTDKAFKHQKKDDATKSAKKGKRGKRGKSSARSKSQLAAAAAADGGSDVPASHGASLDPSHAANPVALSDTASSRGGTTVGDDGGSVSGADGTLVDEGVGDDSEAAEPLDPKEAEKAAKAAAKAERLAAAQKAKEEMEAQKAAIAALPWYDDELGAADAVDAKRPQYNAMDGHVNRVSLTGEYAVVNNLPLNPRGRHNLKGRGVLPRHGPNHAMVSIITRVKRKGRVVVKDQWEQPVLEFIMVTRADGSYICPGGLFPDLDTAREEQTSAFLKEILHARKMPKTDRADIIRKLSHLFAAGTDISSGFADEDSRNTDNAWVELTVTHYHDETGEATRLLKLAGGSDKAAGRGKSAKVKGGKPQSGKDAKDAAVDAKDIPAGSAVWVEMTPSIELAGGEEELLMAVREDAVAKIENVSGKKRRTYFKKWTRLRNYMQDKLKMDKIATLNPGNHAVRHFNEKQYKRLNDEHQRAFMRCIGPAVRYPNLAIGCYAHNAGDYTEFSDYFSNVVSSYCGMEEAECIDRSAKLTLTLDEFGDRKTGMKSSLDFAKLGLPFVFIRIEAIRNFESYPLSPAMNKQQRIDMEEQLVKVFELLQASHKLKGNYYSLTPGHPNFVDGALKSRLASSHPSFPVERGDDIDRVASSSKDWPIGRGCYIATDTRFSVMVGGKDHINLALHQKGRNLGESLVRAEFLVSQIADAFLTATGQTLPPASTVGDEHGDGVSRKTSQTTEHAEEGGSDGGNTVGALSDDERAAELAELNARKEVRNALWHTHPRFGKLSMLPLRCGAGFVPSVTVPLPNSVISETGSDEDKEAAQQTNERLKINLVMEDSGMATITPISHFAASEFMLCEQLYSAVKELKRLDATKSKKGRQAGSVRKVKQPTEHGTPDKQGSDGSKSSKSARSVKSSKSSKSPKSSGKKTVGLGSKPGKTKRLSPAAKGGPKKASAKKEKVGGKGAGKAAKALPKSPPKLGAEKQNVLPPIGGREATAKFPKDPTKFPVDLDAAAVGTSAAALGVDGAIASVASHVAKSATFAGLTEFVAHPSPPAGKSAPLAGKGPWQPAALDSPTRIMTKKSIEAQVNKEHKNASDEDAAATIIQNNYRKYASKKKKKKKIQVEKEDAAARVIQRSYRKYSKSSKKGASKGTPAEPLFTGADDQLAPAAAIQDGLGAPIPNGTTDAAFSEEKVAEGGGFETTSPTAAAVAVGDNNTAKSKSKEAEKKKKKKKKKKKEGSKAGVPPLASESAAIAV